MGLASAVASNKKQRSLELIEFSPFGKKKLEPNLLSKKVGFLDRETTIEQLYQALEKLAAVRGTPSLDKKKVPIIGITGRSETGKTEFLRWVFNNCCTFQNKPTENADNLLQRLNNASPGKQENLKNLLVLFASFNQTSPYLATEGPIMETTIERLLRSFHGNASFGSGSNERFKGYYAWHDIIDTFTKKHGSTGFIFLLDELSKLKDDNESEYHFLINSILSFSQECFQKGIYFAVVGSSLSIYDLGNLVLTRSGRTIEPVAFPSEMPELEKETRSILRNETSLFQGADSTKASIELSLSVTMKLLQSSSKLGMWERYACNPSKNTRLSPPQLNYKMPKDRQWADYVFLLASRTVLKVEVVEDLTESVVGYVVDALDGHLMLETVNGRLEDWNNPRGTLSLPGWRLLQFSISPSSQLFSLVKNWVIVETRRMFYEYGPSETTKTWETTIMALLELRKAMHQAVNGRPPSFQDIIQGIRLHHNLSPEALGVDASDLPTESYFAKMPHANEDVSTPTLHLSSLQNEEGVEGVLRQCFENMSIFFQMKLHQKVTPKMILDALKSAHDRALKLGYHQSEGRILLLFVTGAIDKNVKKHYTKWPASSVVFSDNALIDLFQPFGDGYIQEVIKNIKRD